MSARIRKPATFMPRKWLRASLCRWSNTQCPSLVEDNPVVCHSERSEESRHFFAPAELSNAGILRFAQNDRWSPILLRMTNNPYQYGDGDVKFVATTIISPAQVAESTLEGHHHERIRRRVCPQFREESFSKLGRPMPLWSGSCLQAHGYFVPIRLACRLGVRRGPSGG